MAIPLTLLTAGLCDPDDEATRPGDSNLTFQAEPWAYIQEQASLGNWEVIASEAEEALGDPDAPISRDAALAVYAAALGRVATEDATSKLSDIKEEVEAIDPSQLPQEAGPWLDEAHDAIASLPSDRMAPEDP